MTTTPYPYPREKRESDILVGNGTAGPYGPSSFKIFDIADIVVLMKKLGESSYSDVTLDATVTKSSGAAFDTFNVNFAAPVLATTKFKLQSRRVHERSTAVTRGGSLSAIELERELSKQGTVIEELRRDADRGLAFQPDFDGDTLLPELSVGKVLGWSTGGLVNMTPVASGMIAIPATPNRYLRNDPLGNLEVLTAVQTSRLDALANGMLPGDFPTKAAAAAWLPAPSIESVRINGYYTAGDGGGALYKKVVTEPTHIGKFQSADGAWWEIVFENKKVFAAALGVFGGGAGDHTAAIQSVIDAAPDGSEIIFPKSTFKFKHVLIEKSVVLNWGMSSLTVDPERDSTSNALPAMFFRGALATRLSIATVTNKLTDRVTLQAGTAADYFSPGDYVEVLDLTFVPAWDDGLPGQVGTGFTGRKEVNRVKSTSGATIFLEKSLEWPYSSTASATVAKITPLMAPGINNIGRISEPDTGTTYSGSTVLGPHLMAFYLCVDPKVDNVTAENWQMHVCQFSMCQSPVIENSEGRYPYRPETAGHGYFVQFDRCNRGLARRNSGYGLRHLVDWTQTYDCKSVFNTAYAPNGGQFVGHGQGARRCVSEDDAVHFGGGLRCAGWSWGNPTFSADYDLSIIRPKAYGRCDGVESTKIFRCGNTADGFTVIDPTVDVLNSVVGQYAMVFAVEAGKNVSVQGGRIDIQWLNGGSTSDSVLYARTMNGVKCENISFRDVRMVGARSDNSYILRVEDVVGIFSVKNCTFQNVDSTVSGVYVSGASEELDITENRLLGGGFRGISVTNAPTRNKRIRDNVFQGVWTATLHGAAV